MSAKFAERSPMETGFAGVFDARIAPELDRLESDRTTLLATAKRHVAIVLGVGLAIGLLLAWVVGSGGGWVSLFFFFGLPVFMSGAGAVMLWKWHSGRWAGSVAETVMPVICDFLGGLDYDREAVNGFPLERLEQLGVIKSFDRATLSDRIEGRYRDTPFELVEARLVRKSGSSKSSRNKSKTVFDGLLFRIGVPDPVPSPILIARDYGAVRNKLGELFSGGSGRGMPKVDLPHDRFEQHFDVHAADPEIARDLLTPAFLENLLAIGDSEGGDKGVKGLEAGFEDDSFFLALSRKGNFLAMGSLTTSVLDIENELHGVFDDLALVYRIIDRLHGDHPPSE